MIGNRKVYQMEANMKKEETTEKQEGIEETEEQEKKEVNPPEENQEKGNEQNFAGKFKSVEELEKAYQEAERMITEANERAKRAEELADLLNNIGNTGKSKNNGNTEEEKIDDEDYSKIIENPKEVLEKFGSLVEKRIISKIKEEEEVRNQMKTIHDYFYTTYSDLKGYEPIVGYFGEQMQGQSRGLSTKDFLAKVAEKSRAYIADKKLKAQGNSNTDGSLNLVDGRKALEQKNVNKTEEKNFSEEEELREYLIERNKEIAKKIHKI